MTVRVTVVRPAELGVVEQRPLDLYRYQGSRHSNLIHFADLRDCYDDYIRFLSEGVLKRISRTLRYQRALQGEPGEISFELIGTLRESPDCIHTHRSSH
jgi:hypothetical protein